ncbi:hypothetical protein LTR91_013414 [Friedmanniomyces endolithicus]|uniref:F-box domain-containing protein n=1 Tax=Friedmanniomyces endolithicus TaxID=329885 RepID=A0AAN6QPA1_9PEZI|nr:hypothetical protein LTR94_002105 [Friedmanniomyces endolithicus]KAK0809419.1 hypothetical protein LTR59_002663 [Friedmanniomyces endolithicus]KAK0819753.1 hypothetical protein LTR38_000506 [Friedmanniomyces endolithicus]KAK0822008.1 hypothetical protein LTR75_000143 [Friedmanniomyces endolithicus]KAK0858208.1 hypothetical protein LTR03_000217 [Friedmanniomyces endolithicus]
MPLDTLPVELRLHIYEYLPELRVNRHKSVAPHTPLTPGICRASTWLRRETLPIYARNAHFGIQADNNAYPKGNRVPIWLSTLNDSIKHVQSFQLSRHWVTNGPPTRGQGHVGFYIFFERRSEDRWKLSGGTYPLIHDARARRGETVLCLLRVLHQTVLVEGLELRGEKAQLRREDVEGIAAAMDLVATRPFTADFLADQSEEGRESRRKALEGLEGALYALWPEWSGSRASQQDRV